MIKEVIKTLRDKKDELLRCAPIIIEKGDNYFIMVVKDYMEVIPYSDIVDKIDPDKTSDNISFSLLWNTERQKINKGTFYVIWANDKKYNIWIDDADIKLDERIDVGEEKHERILSVNKKTKKFHFTFFKHDEIGSTFYTMYYHMGNVLIPSMNFSKEEAKREIGELLASFSSVEDIDAILEIDEIKEIILNELDPDEVKLTKKMEE